jgi:polyisoprenoid-binding protein YceI
MRIALALPCLVLACGGEPVKLADKAEKLEIQAPKSRGAERYVIDGSSGQLGFDMDAPIEKIRGKVPPSALSGEIFVDPADLGKTTGLVHVDLAQLELFQRKAAAEGEAFGEETKNETQNKHARDWLEIGADVPPDVLAKNSVIEFSLREVKDLSATDLGKLTGSARKVTFTATGEFLLHQRKASKSVKLEATFTYAGERPTQVQVKSLEPLEIGLDEYDVHPREGFGKLAAKTLQVLSPKVASAAAVHLEFTAKLAPDAAPSMRSVADGAAPAVAGQPPSGAPHVDPDAKAFPKSPAKPG